MVRRSGNTKTWNGYVTVPADHWTQKDSLHYDDIYGGDVTLTYKEGRTYGFDHSYNWDVWPFEVAHYERHDNYALTSLCRCTSQRKYITREKVIEEVQALKLHLMKNQKIMRTPGEATWARSIFTESAPSAVAAPSPSAAAPSTVATPSAAAAPSAVADPSAVALAAALRSPEAGVQPPKTWAQIAKKSKK
jgi:hypothetical protein